MSFLLQDVIGDIFKMYLPWNQFIGVMQQTSRKVFVI